LILWQRITPIFHFENIVLLKNKAMKTFFPLLLLALPLAVLQGQPCPNGASAHYDLHANAIKARFNAGGALFTDFFSGQFVPNPTGGSDPSTIFAANLWMGGLTADGDVKLLAGLSNSKLSAGPALQNWPDEFYASDCGEWDRIFHVKGADIAAFLNNPPATVQEAIALYPDIMGWPGNGNSYFEAVHGFPLPQIGRPLAPFWDVDGDIRYDPMAGDFPVVIYRYLEYPLLPHEIVWFVNNNLDTDPDIPLEIAVTAWAFECPAEDALNNTIFTVHRTTYLGLIPDTLLDVHMGIWADFDIGCPIDDYVGTAPGLQAIFAYNQDQSDGQPGTSCDDLPTFYNNPPVQSASFLNVPLEKAMYYNSASVGTPPPATTDPITRLEHYRYLTGNWRDGTPLTLGGTGYNPGSAATTDFFFPDDPADPQGWSMCSEAFPLADPRVVGSLEIGSLLSGAVNELVIAWTHHPNPQLPCNLGNTFNEMASVRAAFDSDFQDVCSPLLRVEERSSFHFTLFPNPASAQLTIDPGDQPIAELAVFGLDGKQYIRLASPALGPIRLDVSKLHAGMYLMRMVGENGAVASRKWVKM
jgi:hypothetical protein